MDEKNKSLYEKNQWVSLERLLKIEKIPIPVLDAAIEQYGVSFFNSVGRWVLADDNVKADARQLLKQRYSMLHDPDYERYEEMLDVQGESSLDVFGWFAEDLPDFDSLNPHYSKDSNTHKSVENNDIAGSGLLNEPSRKDAWFTAIDDMAKEFHSKNGKLPNNVQAWQALQTNPPQGYSITNGKDKGGEDCLNMPSESSLGQSAFNKRWGKYTADNPQQRR